MAPQLGQVVANAWEAVVGSTPYDNINNEYWMFDNLRQGESFESIDGGRTIDAPIEYALNTTVSSYSDTEAINVTRIDVFDQVTYAWKEYAGTVLMSVLEKAKNQGSGRKFDLLAAKLKNLKNSFASVINTDLFGDGTGNSSKVIGGLQLIVSTTPTTGTVGGVNRATFTFWRNQQASGAKSAVAFDTLRSVLRTVYNNCSSGVDAQHPEYICMEQTPFEGFESLLIANERVTGKEKKDANAGFKNEYLMFKDCPVSYDRACPTGNAYLLNYRDLRLGYLKGEWMHGFPSVEPANQTIEVFKVVTIANLFSPNPRRLGVVSGIT